MSAAVVASDRGRLDASAIIAVWVARVEAVLAVVGDGPAWAPGEPAQSCDAPSPQRSAATLGLSLWPETIAPGRLVGNRPEGRQDPMLRGIAGGRRAPLGEPTRPAPA